MPLEEQKFDFKCPLENFFYNSSEKSLDFVEECTPCCFSDFNSKKIIHPNDVCNLNLSQKQVGILKEVYFSNAWVDDSNEGFLKYLSWLELTKKD